jgi:ABC-type enterochelin transport system, permease component
LVRIMPDYWVSMLIRSKLKFFGLLWF